MSAIMFRTGTVEWILLEFYIGWSLSSLLNIGGLYILGHTVA
jgi:hypothetical protein